MTYEDKTNSLQETADSRSTSDSFPTEPFACPNCGQMLAPNCKVCVACREPIDFSKVKAPVIIPPPVPKEEEPPQIPGRAQFSWPIFFLVFCAYLAMAFLARAFLNTFHFKIFLSSVLVGSSAWVVYDAYSRHVPHPFRWGVSSLLLWIIAFPWYLSRRRAPEAPCPLMEGKSSLFIRALIWVVLIFFVLSLIEAFFVHKLPH